MATFELVELLVKENVSVLSLFLSILQVWSDQFHILIVVLVPQSIMFDYGVVVTSETRESFVDYYGIKSVDVAILVLEVFGWDAKAFLMCRHPTLVEPNLLLKFDRVLEFCGIVREPLHMDNEYLGQ